MIDKKIQEYFSYGDIPKEWTDVDTGYETHAVMTRLDAFYDGKNLKFLEFNTDNPGGKGWTDIFEEIMFFHKTYKDIFSPEGKIYGKKVVDGLFNAVINSFKDFRGENREPSVALIEYRDSGFLGDPEIVKDYFNSKGVRTELIDPRDFDYSNGNLLYRGVKYNTCVRCVKAQELLLYPEELKNFISAYLNRDMCMVNSFRSLFGSEKSLLSLLFDRNFYHYFTEKEIDAIEKYIPHTIRLSDENAFSSEGEEVNTGEYLLKNQENFVLKPSWGYGGKGVIIGKHVSEEKWKEEVNKLSGNKGWISQEYVNIPRMETPVITEKGTVEIKNKYFNLSPYVFGGKYVGSLGRISDEPVINVSAGGGIVPVYVV